MTASTKGRWPLLGGRRGRLRGVIQRPTPASDGEHLAAILGDYLFGLDAQPAPAQLTQSRIPDAEGGFRWILSWRTDIPGGGNWDGTEQRIATLAEPRHRYEGSFFLDATDLRGVRRLLSQSPAAEYELPMPHEAVSALLEVTGGTIYVTSTYADWIETGRRIYVRGADGTGYTTTITGASGGTINVADSPPVGGRFPAVHTLIFPLETVRLEDDHQLRRYPVNAGRWAWKARAAAREVLGTGGTLTTYDGWTVLNRRPRQTREWPEAIAGGVEFLDNGATMTSETSWSRSKHRRAVEVAIKTPADRQWVKAFLAERRGRFVPCLAPTWGPDLTLYEQPTAGTNTIRVTDDYLGEWWPSLAHRRLQLERAGSAVQYVVVDSVTQGSGYQELLLRDDIAAVPIIKVSFLESSRLDSDEIAIEYGTGWRGRVSLPLCTVQEVLDSPAWPTSSATMTEAAAGFGPWSSAWACGPSSGNLTDLIGAVTLTANSTPLYRRAGAMPGGFAVGFDSAADRFAGGDVFDSDATTSIAIYLCARVDSSSGTQTLVCKGVTAFQPAWYLTLVSGQLRMRASDGSTNVDANAPISIVGDGLWHDIIAVIDRDADVVQVFVDDQAGTPVSIAAYGSIGNSAAFSIGGAATGLFGPPTCRVAFCAIASGSIVPNIRASALAIIASMKAYTGR